MSIQALHTQNRTLALEAFSMNDVTGALSRIFPGMASALNSFIGLFSSDQPALALNADQRSFVQLVNKATYLDMVDLEVMIPEGMKSSYLQYVTSLLAVTTHAEVVMKEVLSPISTYLAMLISNKDRKFDTNVQVVRALKQREKERTDAMVKLTAHFAAGSVENKGTYGKAIGRNSEWEQVFRLINDASKRLNGVNRKELNAKIAEVSELVSVVLGQIERGDFVDASPQTVQTLGETVYQVARELEFFSATYFRVTAVNTALESVINETTKFLKK